MTNECRDLSVLEADILQCGLNLGEHITLNEMYEVWIGVKSGIKRTSYEKYIYYYNRYIKRYLGNLEIKLIKKSTIKRFYNILYNQHNLSISTLVINHAILRQIFEMAVDDEYITNNPVNGALDEVRRYKEPKKRNVLTKAEQDIFLNNLKTQERFKHYYPAFAVMLGTGLRVGELSGLMWGDVDFDNNYIYVRRTLVWVNKGEHARELITQSTKTIYGNRKIPMFNQVRDILQDLKTTARHCKDDDYVFLSKTGHNCNCAVLNQEIKIFIRWFNHTHNETLPDFSCHTLRHTFATRLCESGVNVKFIQSVMGHANIRTTMDIYVEAGEDLIESTFKSIDETIFFNN